MRVIVEIAEIARKKGYKHPKRKCFIKWQAIHRKGIGHHNTLMFGVFTRKENEKNCK